MSLLHFFDDFGFQHPRHLMDQQFGLALTPEDLLTVVAGPMLTRGYYNRPWRRLEATANDLGSRITADGEKFKINLDVQQFTPEEITVKTADGYIVVEGKHEEKKDEHGYISRQFTRRYALPVAAAPESVESHLSSDGVLTITASRKLPAAIQGERKVPIAHTGPVRKIKDQSNAHAAPVRKDIKDQSIAHTEPVRKEIKDESNARTGLVRKEVKDESNSHTGPVRKEIKDQSIGHTGPVRKEVKDESNSHAGPVRKEIKDQSKAHTGPVRKEVKDQSNANTGPPHGDQGSERRPH